MEIGSLLSYYSESIQAYNSADKYNSRSGNEEESGELLNPKDSVNFSEEALAAAKNALSADATADADENNAFGEQAQGQAGSQEGGQVSGQGNVSSQGGGGSSSSEDDDSEEIQSQINQLTARLGQIMSSNLPEDLKSAQIGAIQAQIAALTAQLGSLA